jgi:hypothetical protein
VSSTNATLDPCYFKSHTPHQLHSSVEVSPIACLSEVEFSNNRSDIFMRYTNFYRLLKLRLTLFTQSTNSTEHSQSHPIFESGIGEFQHIPEMESFNGPYFVDPVHHSYILSMATIPRIVLESLSDNSITSVNKIYNFKITSIGASVRQGDFLELPNRYWPRASPVCQISKA